MSESRTGGLMLCVCDEGFVVCGLNNAVNGMMD